MHPRSRAPPNWEHYPLGLHTSCLLGEDREYYRHRLIADSPRLFKDIQNEVELFRYQDSQVGNLSRCPVPRPG